MQAETGLGVGVVGSFGAMVQIDAGVLLAGGDDLDAAGAEQGAQAHAHGQGIGLFRLAAGEAATVIVAAVGCVEDDDETGRRGGRGLGGG